VTHCLHCGSTTSNGLALCELCRRKALADMEFLPIYFRNLARWRPGRAGSRPVPGSRVLYDGATKVGTGDRISDALDETFTMLTTKARELTKDRPHFPRPLTRTDAVLCDDMSDTEAEYLNDHPARACALLCQAFERHLTSIATLDWCGDFVRDLGEHEEILRTLTETSVPGWYAGGCKRCDSGTYVVPGLTWVTCKACGLTSHAADHLEIILGEAREWVATPANLAGALVALLDTEASVLRLRKRIGKWGDRERIEAVRGMDKDGDPCGPKRYRLGEVLDLLMSEGATRLEDEGMMSA
jgi:hypothetical protein